MESLYIGDLFESFTSPTVNHSYKPLRIVEQ